MSAQRERLEGLLERLERLRHTRPINPGETHQTAQAQPDAVLLPSPVPPHDSRTDFSTLLELLALRDRYIQSELLRLQRTLSRQNFRGAESARRLVRRLARRAEQNVVDIDALKQLR